MGDRKAPSLPPSERAASDPVSRQVKPDPPPAPPRKEDVSVRLVQLKEKLATASPGGCRMLSKGPECPCALCVIDDVIAEIDQLKQRDVFLVSEIQKNGPLALDLMATRAELDQLREELTRILDEPPVTLLDGVKTLELDVNAEFDRAESAEAKLRAAEQDGPRCQHCGGPHLFDTSIPSVIWNLVVRENGLPDFLCAACILREFVKRGESFTAELWGAEFYGTTIEVTINGKEARDSAKVSAENTELRAVLTSLREQIATVKADAGELELIKTLVSDRDEGGTYAKVDALADDLNRSREDEAGLIHQFSDLLSDGNISNWSQVVHAITQLTAERDRLRDGCACAEHGSVCRLHFEGAKERFEAAERENGILIGNVQTAIAARDAAEAKLREAAGQCDGCGFRWTLNANGDPVEDAFCPTCYSRASESLREQIGTVETYRWVNGPPYFEPSTDAEHSLGGLVIKVVRLAAIRESPPREATR